MSLKMIWERLYELNRCYERNSAVWTSPTASSSTVWTPSLFLIVRRSPRVPSFPVIVSFFFFTGVSFGRLRPPHTSSALRSLPSPSVVFRFWICCVDQRLLLLDFSMRLNNKTLVQMLRSEPSLGLIRQLVFVSCAQKFCWTKKYFGFKSAHLRLNSPNR